jgi:hypothetical protein
MVSTKVQSWKQKKLGAPTEEETAEIVNDSNSDTDFKPNKVSQNHHEKTMKKTFGIIS